MKSSIIKILLLALVGAIAGCSGTPDCGDKQVLETIANNYAEELANSQIPDLAFSIAKERIKFSTDMVTEVSRNKESKSYKCSARLSITFPKGDLERAAKSDEGRLMAATAGVNLPTEPVYNAMIDYTVTNPLDKNSQKDGPMVNMRMHDSSRGNVLGSYIVAYTALALTANDITDGSSNSKAWDKEIKAETVTECSKYQSAKHCQCKLDAFEKVLPQDDFYRIAYITQKNPMMGMKYKNFSRLANALNAQCPLPPQAVSTANPAVFPEQASQVSTQPQTPTVAPASQPQTASVAR